METKFKILILSMLAVLVYVISIYTFFPLAEATTGIIPLAEMTTGISVPLYFHPQFTLWDFLIDLKNQYPNVPIIAVINPNNGPDDAKDNAYAIEVLKLQSAGIKVLGYTFTDYGRRDTTLIFQDISKYRLWYNVDGIFFDEVANFGQEEYLETLDDYANALGASYTVGNPGTDIPPSYIGILDNYVIYENRGLPDLNYIEERYSDLDKRHFSITAYGVMDFDSNYILALSKYVQYMYITNDDLPNPYDTFSIHLERLGQNRSAQAAAGQNQTMSSDAQAAAGQNQTMSSDAKALMALDIPELKDNLMDVKEALANGNREDALTGITGVENQLLLLENTPTFTGDIQKIKESISKTDLKKALDDITNIQSEIIKVETEVFKAQLANPELMASQQDNNNGQDEEEDNN